MEDDIDYGALFGVTPEGNGGSGGTAAAGPEQGAGSGNDPGGAAAEGTGQGEGTQPQGTSLQAPPPAPGDEAEGGGNVPNSDTIPGQEAGSSLQAGSSAPFGDADRPPSAQTPPPAPDNAQTLAQVQARARDEAQRAIDEAFARSGLRNPYTGQPVTSKAEYDAYRERYDAERRDQILKQTGMSGEEFDRFVQDLPAVREAREAREAAEKAQREAREAAARAKLDEEVREIGAMDPSIKSLEDLAKMPTYPRFYELVQLGNTLTDAFRLANFDALTQRAAAGARQTAVNAARSKDHLEQTRNRGTGAVSVPAEVKEQYRLFNPDATDEEIQKHYARSVKPS